MAERLSSLLFHFSLFLISLFSSWLTSFFSTVTNCTKKCHIWLLLSLERVWLISYFWYEKSWERSLTGCSTSRTIHLDFHENQIIGPGGEAVSRSMKIIDNTAYSHSCEYMKKEVEKKDMRYPTTCVGSHSSVTILFMSQEIDMHLMTWGDCMCIWMCKWKGITSMLYNVCFVKIIFMSPLL